MKIIAGHSPAGDDFHEEVIGENVDEAHAEAIAEFLNKHKRFHGNVLYFIEVPDDYKINSPQSNEQNP